MPCGWRRQTWRRFRGPGVYPHQLAWVLTVPLRRLVQPPQRLVARLGLPPMSRVLELGPGPGYFSAALARAVPGGGVVLCDAQRQMLAKARSRLNVGLAPTAWFVQGDAASLPFETAFFDAAVLVAASVRSCNLRRACSRCIACCDRPGCCPSLKCASTPMRSRWPRFAG